MDQNQFPANTHAQKVKGTRDDKVVEKVTVGEVSRRKKPMSRRLRDVFVADDAQSVGSYILFDVIIPATKDVIADVVSQAIERMLFGSVRSTSRRTGQAKSLRLDVEECKCFYYDWDPTIEDDYTCVCGHSYDEHDEETHDCKVMVEII